MWFFRCLENGKFRLTGATVSEFAFESLQCLTYPLAKVGTFDSTPIDSADCSTQEMVKIIFEQTGSPNLPIDRELFKSCFDFINYRTLFTTYTLHKRAVYKMQHAMENIFYFGSIKFLKDLLKKYFF